MREGKNWGIGEAGLFRGLSSDDCPDYEQVLTRACAAVAEQGDQAMDAYREYPSIVIGLEQALHSIKGSTPFELFPSSFLNGEPIPINGLIWMGNLDL